jgi:hypothetical protein
MEASKWRAYHRLDVQYAEDKWGGKIALDPGACALGGQRLFILPIIRVQSSLSQVEWSCRISLRLLGVVILDPHPVR